MANVILEICSEAVFEVASCSKVVASNEAFYD